MKGVNIAGLIGSFFTVGILSGNDVHRCLELLVDSLANFDRLCAMHALIVHSNDKLCKSRFASATSFFREKLSVQDPATGHFSWGDSGPSRFLVAVGFLASLAYNRVY